MAHGVMAEEMH